jgi:hypothetical protein
VLAFLGGAAATIAVVDGPFFALAPSSMWHMVVTDQLGRPARIPFLYRTITFSTLHGAIASIHGNAAIAVSAGFGVVFVALVAAAVRMPGARPVACIAVAQVIVLLTAPSFFTFYVDYLAPALALVVAAAAHTARARRRDHVRSGLVAGFVAAAACITVSSVLVRPVGFIQPFPTDQLADTLPHVRCIMTVSPMALIELDALSSDLSHHCPQWVDATGRTYGTDALPGPHYIRRLHNQKWQSDVLHYLTSGGAIVLIGSDGSLNARTLHALRANRLLVQDGSVSLYEVGARTRPARLALPHTG